MNGFIGILYELVVIQSILSIDGTASVYQEGASGYMEFGAHIEPGNVKVIPQYFDADIAVADDKNVCLIQCKASDKGETLTHGDLIQILIEGAGHLQKLRSNGDKREVSLFIIATNRPISRDINTLNTELARFSTKGSTKDSTCPKVLDKRHKEPRSVLDWAKSLKISNKGSSGKTTKTTIDNSLASLVAELAVRMRYALIREGEVQKRFRDSLRRYGLNESEINKVDTHLRGELLEASRRGEDVITALRRQFSSGERNLSLCPEKLRPLEDELVEHHWSRDAYGETLESAVKDGLPRLKLVQDLVNALENLVSSPNERGLALVGDGGVGKSQLLFQIPSLVRRMEVGAPKHHLFAFADCRPQIRNLMGSALHPFFNAHCYVSGQTDGSALLDRLKIAFDACGSDTLVWILIPNADELSHAELTDLLTLLTASLESEPRFVLTARQDPWHIVAGESATQFLRPMSVGLLDDKEVEHWLSVKGGMRQRSYASVTPMRSDALAPYSNYTDEFDLLAMLRHPLAFQALQRWLRNIQEDGQQRSALSNLVQGDTQLVTEFMSYLRKSYVDRVHKHCKRFGVSREQISDLFEQLWKRQHELSTIAPSQWSTHLCSDLGPGQQPDHVVRQFVQAGVLRYTDKHANRIQWAVPYQQ